MNILKKILPSRLTLRYGNIKWPERPPNITDFEIFLWGYIKMKVLENHPYTTTG
jgi:hypothetical protein